MRIPFPSYPGLEELLVIWDRSYCERLWCIFELAAFLKAHADEATVKVRVQPLSLATLCFDCYWLGSLD